MKTLLSVVVLLLSFCQSVEAKKIFVEMEYHKNRIKLDDGSNKKPQPIKDENGKDLKFVSLIGALNYMSLQGWDLVGSKTSGAEGCGAVVGGIVISSSDNKISYIFCKDVTDGELQEAVNNSYKE